MLDSWWKLLQLSKASRPVCYERCCNLWLIRKMEKTNPWNRRITCGEGEWFTRVVQKRVEKYTEKKLPLQHNTKKIPISAREGWQHPNSERRHRIIRVWSIYVGIGKKKRWSSGNSKKLARGEECLKRRKAKNEKRRRCPGVKGVAKGGAWCGVFSVSRFRVGKTSRKQKKNVRRVIRWNFDGIQKALVKFTQWNWCKFYAVNKGNRKKQKGYDEARGAE